MAQVQCTPLPSQRAATQTGIAALILIVSLFFLWGVIPVCVAARCEGSGVH
jgi:hypothetical protein